MGWCRWKFWLFAWAGWDGYCARTVDDADGRWNAVPFTGHRAYYLARPKGYARRPFGLADFYERSVN